MKRSADSSGVAATETSAKRERFSSDNKAVGSEKKTWSSSKSNFSKKPFNSSKKPVFQSKKFGNNVTNSNAPPAKKDWNKMKQDKKELKVKRKERRVKSKDIFELTAQAKKIYEKLKCKTEENRPALAKNLHNLLRGSNVYSKMVLAHDTARVVQCLFKVAPNDIKGDILKEILPSVPQMVSSKYSHFCISAVLKHGTSDMRDQVINALLGHIVKLASHSLATSTLDSIYVTWASNKQRAFMRQEFYSDLYKRDKDVNLKSIADCYKTTPHMKNIVLGNVKQHISHLANKKLVDNSLVHSLILDYLMEAKEEDRNEVCNLFINQLASLASTKEGAKAASQIFYFSAPKERRSALKSLKDHIEKICIHEFGFYLVLAILNTIDDTKMVKKYILDVIVQNLELMVQHEWGRKIIEWIVLPGDKSMFHPQFTVELNKGLINSKKDAEIRQAEILEATETEILAAIAKRPEFWISGGHIALTTATVLKKSTKTDLLEKAFKALATVVADKDWEVELNPVVVATPVAVEAENPTIKKFKKKKNPMEDDAEKEEKEVKKELGIENAGLHIALKKLVKEDKDRLEKQCPVFCDFLVEELTSEVVEKWSTINRACFLLVTMVENSSDETKAKLIESLKPLSKALKSSASAGSKLLLQKIK